MTSENLVSLSAHIFIVFNRIDTTQREGPRTTFSSGAHHVRLLQRRLKKYWGYLVLFSCFLQISYVSWWKPGKDKTIPSGHSSHETFIIIMKTHEERPPKDMVAALISFLLSKILLPWLNVHTNNENQMHSEVG